MPAEDAVQALWVGHASLLVQLGGVTFFTDPVFSERCSPLSFAGPKYASLSLPLTESSLQVPLVVIGACVP